MTKRFAGVIIIMHDYVITLTEVCLLKKISFFCRLAAVMTAAALLASCKSAETVNTTAVTTEITEISTSETSSAPVPLNWDHGGVLLADAPVTAAAPAPVPGGIITDAGEADQTVTAPAATTAPPVTASPAATTATTAAKTSSASKTTKAVSPDAPDTPVSVATKKETVTTAATTIVISTSAPADSIKPVVSELPETKAAETTAQPAAVISGTVSKAKNSYKAFNHSKVRGVWISYIELYDHLFNKSEADFRTAFGTMMDNCTAFGINTVYVHVRSHGDAYYYSSLFPFTKNFKGTLGSRTSYDPLEIMIAEAHKRNISFHAWINPLRLCSTAEMESISADYPIGKWYRGPEKGTYIVNVNGTWYLNPAYSAVIDLIGENVREIVSGYDVDGVNIDDYFYPTTDASFDNAAFAGSGYGDLSAFRINNINAMVKAMYNGAHEGGSALYGAAPQGNNINNLNVLYADTKAWCRGGYIDYFAPQIYYGFDNSGVPYKNNVNEWLSIVSGTKTKLYIGLAVYKAGNEDKWAGSGKYEWQNTDTMLKRQTEYADTNGCSGIVLYSYNYLFNSKYRTPAMKAEADNLKAILTAS